jgi:MFS family permease
VKALGWRSPFSLFALTIPLLIAAFMAITDHEGRRAAIKPPLAIPGEKPPVGTLLGIYIVAVWMAIMGTSIATQMPFLIAERGFADPRHVAWIIAANSVGMVLASPFFGKLAARFNTRALILLILTVFAVSNTVAGVFTPLVSTIVASGITGFAATYILPTCASYVLTNLPANTHGRAMGGLIGVIFLGTFVNQFVIYPVNAALGIGPGFIFIGAVNALGVLIALTAPLLWRARSKPA